MCGAIYSRFKRRSSPRVCGIVVSQPSALHLAATTGDTINIKRCRAPVDEIHQRHGTTPLVMAARNGHIRAILVLLSAGASVNKSDKYGATPTRHNRIGVIDALLKAGADTDLGDRWNMTPVFIAAKLGHVQALMLLIAAGSNVNIATSSEGWTPLHVAAYYGREDCVMLLLQHGADRSDVARNGSTAYAVACSRNFHHIAGLLIGQPIKMI